MKKIIIIVIVLALLGGIYYFFIHNKMASKSNGNSTNAAANGEALPVKSLRVFSSAGSVQNFDVEVAESEEALGRGLMYRTDLAENKGMLFLFPDMKVQHFWMKNTLISLDMIFMDESRTIIHIVKNATPCVTQKCDIYSSVKPARYVLEVKGGTAEKLQLREGDRVNWDD